MGFRCVLFILGLVNPGGVVVVPIPGNVCLSDMENFTVTVLDEACE